MKKQMPKLSLNRETLQTLEKKELGNVMGGAINVSRHTQCTDDTYYCASAGIC